MGTDIIRDIEQILHPRSVAIVGASAKEGKLGRLYMESFIFMGFEKLYPINPSEREILGYKSYTKIEDVPDDIDLAVVITPPESVLPVTRECVQKGVKGIIITTAGFKEKNDKGKEIEKELARLASRGRTRILGPNCVGIYCPASRLPFPSKPGRESGSIGIVSQSGSFAELVAKICTAQGINFSKAISCGNECDLTTLDFLEYLGKDPETKLVVAYLEGIQNGRRFLELAQDISRNKPLIVWKCGRTAAGANAAFSHTGSLSGHFYVWQAVVRQTGIVSVESFEEVLDTVLAFHFLPVGWGRRVAIVSGPGGLAVGAADECLEAGLELASLSSETMHKIAASIPSVGTSVRNPIDLSIVSLLAPNLYEQVIKVLDMDRNVDILLVIGVGHTGFNETISRLAKQIKKPLVLVVPTTFDIAPDPYIIFFNCGIPVYPDSRRALRALKKLAEYSDFRSCINKTTF